MASIDELRSLINEDKPKPFVKALIETFEAMKDSSQEFYALYGRLIQENTNFALSKSYPLFRKKVSKEIQSSELVEMDRILMEKYALHKKERLEMYFEANLILRKGTDVYTLSGPIYITNLRLIGLGNLKSSGGLGALGYAIFNAIARKIQKNIREALGGELPEEEISKFDTFFPITGAYKLKMKKNLSYKMDIDVGKEDKEKIKTFSFKIVPLRMNGEDKGEFAERKKNILNTLANLLEKS